MNFDITPYVGIRESLSQLGIKCGVNNRHQITVSVQDRKVWPICGNSFWITIATGSWHLFTWLPVGYRIPDGCDLSELCKQCMAFGNSAMYRVPETIIDSFELAELDDDEAELVHTAMDKAK